MLALVSWMSCGYVIGSSDSRGATATKASKARALPTFWVTVNPISTMGANYAHHSTMGLVWLKFTVAPLDSLTNLIYFSCFGVFLNKNKGLIWHFFVYILILKQNSFSGNQNK